MATTCRFSNTLHARAVLAADSAGVSLSKVVEFGLKLALKAIEDNPRALGLPPAPQAAGDR